MRGGSQRKKSVFHARGLANSLNMHATGGGAALRRARGREGDFRPTVFLNYPAVDDLIARAGPPRNGRETFEPSTPGELSPRLNTRLNTVEYAYDSGRGTRVREIMLVRSIIPRQTPLDKQQPRRRRVQRNVVVTDGHVRYFLIGVIVNCARLSPPYTHRCDTLYHHGEMFDR